MGTSHEKALGNAQKAKDRIAAHNRAVAKRDAGKTKEQLSNDAFKSGRVSGRY